MAFRASLSHRGSDGRGIAALGAVWAECLSVEKWCRVEWACSLFESVGEDYTQAGPYAAFASEHRENVRKAVDVVVLTGTQNLKIGTAAPGSTSNPLGNRPYLESAEFLRRHSAW